MSFLGHALWGELLLFQWLPYTGWQIYESQVKIEVVAARALSDTDECSAMKYKQNLNLELYYRGYE